MNSLESRAKKSSVFKGAVKTDAVKTSAEYSTRTNWSLIVLGYTQVHSQVPAPALTCLDRQQSSSCSPYRKLPLGAHGADLLGL